MRRVLLLSLLALAIAPSASAATPQAAFGLRAAENPAAGYFIYSAAAGTTRQGAVIVSNTGTASGTVRLSTADATTGATTGTVYLTDKAATKTGGWVSLGASTLTLAPGKHVRVNFTVHVPAGTPAGAYVGGIVAEATQQQPGTSSSGKTSVNIKIRNLSIMAVQVNVPGPAIHKFSIGQVVIGGTHGFQQVVVRVSNEGNVLEKPKGAVTITDAAGKVVETLDFSMDTFLPHTVIDYPIELRKALPPGTYSAGVALRYAAAGAQSVTAKPSFKVTKEDVAKVFSSTTPTLAPPPTAVPTTTARTTTAPTTTAPTTTVVAPATASSTTSGPWLWVALGAIALLLVAILVALLVRRRGGGAPTVAPAPAPTPAPAPVVAPPTVEPPVATVAPAAPAARTAISPPSAPPPAPPVPTPAPVASASEACDPYHYWDVRYDEPVQGEDGVWRFPHRCRTCGLELLATDVTDASAHAGARR